MNTFVFALKPHRIIIGSVQHVCRSSLQHHVLAAASVWVSWELSGVRSSGEKQVSSSEQSQQPPWGKQWASLRPHYLEKEFNMLSQGVDVRISYRSHVCTVYMKQPSVRSPWRLESISVSLWFVKAVRVGVQHSFSWELYLPVHSRHLLNLVRFKQKQDLKMETLFFFDGIISETRALRFSVLSWRT